MFLCYIGTTQRKNHTLERAIMLLPSTMPSIYDSFEFDSHRLLQKYRKRLAVVNSYTDKLRALSDEALKKEADKVTKHFDIKNEKRVNYLFAITREVTYRLLGKFQYDVQVLGGFAALDRNAVQMSTGSGKTITLILPVVAFGFMHKGVHVLTVNDYLSERDWEETHVVYDWFGLTSSYVNNDMKTETKRASFDCDITYCTNATVGFAYLTSCLASDIGNDVKPLGRPLYAAIIDEVDEVLMDDAINPLIIAGQEDLAGRLSTFEYKDKTYVIQEVVDQLKHLRTVSKNYEVSHEQFIISERTWEEIIDVLGVDDGIFERPDIMHILASAVSAIYDHKAYDDYMVLAEPDKDSGSRIALIEKATGRLAEGRSLSDDMHAFVEMKEGVFSGKGSVTSIQITYQVLFNLYKTISGLSGTLGTSYTEFTKIYGMGVVAIPDRVPNQLQQKTHLYVSDAYLYEDMIRLVHLYKSTRHPVLIGATSDLGVFVISDYLKKAGIEHKTLLSIDDNEDAIVALAGQIGSVVVTTDIMGRGTDIKVAETDMERGLVVIQIDSRPNSRVERQFAGRAARQGQPGRYHRLLTLNGLATLDFPKEEMAELQAYVREEPLVLSTYHGDLLMDGRQPNYEELVALIDEVMMANESKYSSSRVSQFQTFSVTDLVQASLVHDVDKVRYELKELIEKNDLKASRKAVYQRAVTSKMSKKERQAIKAKLKTMTLEECHEALFSYTTHIMGSLIPSLRDYADHVQNTVNLAGSVQYPVPPENMVTELLTKYLKEHEADFVLQL